MKLHTLIILASISLATATAGGCRKECEERIKKDCICTMIYDPVCGCNNKTYGNSCEAECSGITNYTKGECGN